MTSRTQQQILEEIVDVNPREERLARRTAAKRRQRRRDYATIAAVLGLLCCGLATLAWYVAIPAAVILLALGMWGTR